MTQTFEQLKLNLELQQKRMMMFAGTVNNKDKQKLSPEEIKQIQKDYVGMYFAFTSIFWGQGKTLGVSWQKALEMMDSFVTSKTKVANNPMNQELVKIHSGFRRDMAKTIMTNRYANEVLREDLRKSFSDYGNKRAVKTKNNLENLYKKYMPEQSGAQQPKSSSFDFAKQRAQQMMFLVQQNINQRAS